MGAEQTKSGEKRTLPTECQLPGWSGRAGDLDGFSVALRSYETNRPAGANNPDHPRSPEFQCHDIYTMAPGADVDGCRRTVGQANRMLVRLDGIDTPELRGRCEAEKAVSLLSVHRGKFAGRVVARVRTSCGTDLSEVMVTYEAAQPSRPRGRELATRRSEKVIARPAIGPRRKRKPCPWSQRAS